MSRVEMARAEAERDKKKQELKTNKPDYTGHGDGEFAEGNLDEESGFVKV